MCTSSDLLGHLAASKNLAKPEPAPVEILKETPGRQDSEGSEQAEGMSMKLAAVAIGGMGLASAATFMFMKSQQS